MFRHTKMALVLTSCIAALSPVTASNAEDADKPSTTQGCDRGMGPTGGPGPGLHGGLPGFGGPPRFDGPGGPRDFGFRSPPYLHALRLTDDQQDKVFSIVHDAEPGMRDAAKAAHKAHEALRGIGSSAQYDEASAASLTQAQAKADGQMLLLRVKTEHAIYLILTPEQRTKLADLEKEREQHEADGPHPH